MTRLEEKLEQQIGEAVDEYLKACQTAAMERLFDRYTRRLRGRPRRRHDRG